MSQALSSNQEAVEWFINKVRMRMLDFADLNELIGKEEIGKEEIGSAIEDAISDYNAIDPPGYTANIWDFPDKEMLIIGTMSKLLLSGAILHWRNQLSYSAGGLTVATHDMGPHYERIGNQLKAQFEQRADLKKRQLNVGALLGGRKGLGSDYGLLHWYENRIVVA